MTIPQYQLETWSKQGATVTPKLIRERIEKVLTSAQSKIQHLNQLNIYLQGSYRNSTNIYGNSDVDVVVQSNQTYFSDTSQLSKSEFENYDRSSIPATYLWDQFKADVVNTLRAGFGSDNVQIGNKSIKVKFDSFDADVVPCFEFRKYTKFDDSLVDHSYISGIQLLTTKERRTVVNYPKLHYVYGASKNQNVNNMYKPCVRIFKNMKSRLVKDYSFDKEVAPSYFIENLLYNVPNEIYNSSTSYYTVVFNILSWLFENKKDMDKFVCQNEQLYLFGNSPEQWNVSDAKTFLSEVIEMWNEWGR